MRSTRTVCGLAALLLLLGGVSSPAQEQEYDRPPKPIEMTQPEYPRDARDRGLEGTVVIEMTIDAEGAVRDPRVLESVEGLDEAAVACVRAWTFEPALKDGEAVSVVARAPVTFRLQDAER